MNSISLVIKKTFRI